MAVCKCVKPLASSRTAPTATQVQAEDAAGTTRLAWAARRIWQAVAKWWAGILSTPVIATLPTNASVAVLVGATVKVRQANTGTVTVAAASGVTPNSPKGAATAAKGEWLTVIKVDTDEWDVL